MAFLSPYSPELNPDEQVWNHLKRRLTQRSIQNKESMKKAIRSILLSIQKKKNLVESFLN
jgi:transposase